MNKGQLLVVSLLEVLVDTGSGDEAASAMHLLLQDI